MHKNSAARKKKEFRIQEQTFLSVLTKKVDGPKYLAYTLHMKINFSTAELHAIMQESATFREKIISLVGRDVLTDYRATIRAKFPFFNGSDKIPAIKWLREELRGKKDELREFNGLCREVYGKEEDWNTNTTLGLAAAKRFVESC